MSVITIHSCRCISIGRFRNSLVLREGFYSCQTFLGSLVSILLCKNKLFFKFQNHTLFLKASYRKAREWDSLGMQTTKQFSSGPPLKAFHFRHHEFSFISSGRETGRWTVKTQKSLLATWHFISFPSLGKGCWEWWARRMPCLMVPVFVCSIWGGWRGQCSFFLDVTFCVSIDRDR